MHVTELPSETAPPTRPRPPSRQLVIAASVAAAIGLLAAVAPISDAAVEQLYARRLYPLIAALLVPLADWTPAPVGLSLTALAAVALVVVVARRWSRGRASGVSRRRLVSSGGLRLVVVAVASFVVFLVLWGAGYRRPPIEARLGLGDESLEPKHARELAERLLARIATDLASIEARDVESALAALRDAVGAVTLRWDGVEPTLPGRVKRLPPGSLLAAGTSGVTYPLLLEAHVDAGLTDVDTLAVAAHELAHVAGYNGEADADLVAFAAGLEATHPYARYAVELRLFARCASELDPEERRALIERLPEAARRDLRESREAAARYRIRWVASSQRVVYDTYLRSQGVAAGIADYSRALELVLKARRAGLLAP